MIRRYNAVWRFGIVVLAVLIAASGMPSHAASAVQEQQLLALAYDSGSGSLLKTTGHALYRSMDSGKTWQAVQLPELKSEYVINGLSTSSAGKGIIYLAVSDLGVLRSNNDGKSWSRRSLGLPNEDVVSVAAHATLPDTVYAVVRQHGIYRSQDGGKTWRFMDRGPVEDIRELIHSDMPGSMQTGWLFAATSNGVERIMDCFCLWQPAGQLAGTVRSIAYDPKHPKHIYAAMAKGVFRSLTGGQTWDRLPSLRQRVMALAVNSAGIVYAVGADGELSRSADEGNSWTRVND